MKTYLNFLVAILMMACSCTPNGNETTKRKAAIDTCHEWAGCPAVPIGGQYHLAYINQFSFSESQWDSLMRAELTRGAPNHFTPIVGYVSYPYTPLTYDWNSSYASGCDDAEEIRRLIYKSAVSVHSFYGPTISPYYSTKYVDPMTNAMAAYFKGSWSRTQENKLFNAVLSVNGPVAMSLAYITTMEIFAQEQDELSKYINNPQFRGDVDTAEYEYNGASSGWGSVRLVRKDYNYESHEIMEDNDSSILIYCHKLYESADVYNRVVIFQNPNWDECIPRNKLVETFNEDVFNDFKYIFYKDYFIITH